MRGMLILAITFLILCGCAGPEPRPEPQPPFEIPPVWYGSPPEADGFLFGYGTAIKKEPALAQKTAIARGRDEVAFAAEVRIATMLRDFMQESGVGNDAQALEFSESVSKHVAYATLEGSVADTIEFQRSGRAYARVSYPLATVRQEALAEASRQEALYNEFKAKQAFEDLEKAIQELE